MLVLEIEKKENKSKDGLKTYVNYDIKYGVEKQTEKGVKYLAEYKCSTTVPAVVDNLISSHQISNYKDLEGRQVVLARRVPYFINENEFKYNIQKCDIIQILK